MAVTRAAPPSARAVTAMKSVRCFLPAVLLCVWACGSRAALVPLSEKRPPAIADVQASQIPDRIQLQGSMGERIKGNEAQRLVKIDTDRLLEGYRKRPGRQTWDGEHVGKWLHAATLAWAHTGDAALRKKLDETVTALMGCQLEDGYLGTYTADQRWTAWDVWAHKYNLIGLLTYIQYTGNEAPLATCRRMADLLCRDFGDGPGQRDILRAGFHAGMAPTSVLEPMVLLYRRTGEQRYADFCDQILRAWEKPHGPQIISRLLRLRRVDKVGNAKAYEMLSCLNGALEYYRTFGRNREILEACLHAWQDIVDKQLYLTGAASYLEHFHDDFDLPNSCNVGETCVTVTWLQFNAQLLRLTGEARFAEQLEIVTLNQLFGAQKPDCTGWGYYVQMQGIKPYSTTLDGHCCLSSGPRGVALLPTFVATTDADGVVVNLFAPGQAELTLHDGTRVNLSTATNYPVDGRITFTVRSSTPKAFAFKLRIPAWSQRVKLSFGGQSVDPRAGADGYVKLHRTWSGSETVQLDLEVAARVIVGRHSNAGSIALAWGPLILAAEETTGATPAARVAAVAVRAMQPAALGLSLRPGGNADGPVFQARGVTRDPAMPSRAASEADLRLLPFAQAGSNGSRYAVWLPVLGAPGFNIARLGADQCSRPRPKNASMIDGDPQSAAFAGDGTKAEQDWFAVTLAAPTDIARVSFCHGRLPRDGGWFDTRHGKPRVQVQRTAGGTWETIGELTDYPATDATKLPDIARSARFTLKLAKPLRAAAVRVIGTPSSGNAPKQNAATCAELEVYVD